jgi:uncharacterized membrane protein YcaP (DUF421 family)
MDSIIRGTVVYLFLMLIFRLSGKRTLSQVTTFDFALLLIIAETTQQAMIDNDHSLTHGALLIITLIGLDIGLSLLKQRMPRLDKWMDDVPLVIVEDGKPIQERLKKCRVDEADIMQAAREHQGLERMDQIKFAVLERSGGITVVPKE